MTLTLEQTGNRVVLEASLAVRRTGPEKALRGPAALDAPPFPAGLRILCIDDSGQGLGPLPASVTDVAHRLESTSP